MGFINGPFDGSLLILFRVFAQLTRDCHWFRDMRVDEVAVASFAAAIDESGRLKVGDEFSNLSRHRIESARNRFRLIQQLAPGQ
jgi:hypothetical protein